MTGDPGMLNSHHFDGSVSSGTGALGWGYWDYDPYVRTLRQQQLFRLPPVPSAAAALPRGAL